MFWGLLFLDLGFCCSVPKEGLSLENPCRALQGMANSLVKSSLGQLGLGLTTCSATCWLTKSD